MRSASGSWTRISSEIVALTHQERLDLFAHAGERFFGTAELVVPGGVAATLVAALAGLTGLVIDQANARWEAVLAEPVGVAEAEYSVPLPTEAIAWFRDRPDPPELSVQFAPELAAQDWKALQRAHRVLYEVLVFRRPALRWAFAREIAARDFRGMVDRYEAVRQGLEAVLASPAARGLLKEWYDLLAGNGPEADDDAAMATLRAHWRKLFHVVTGVEI